MVSLTNSFLVDLILSLLALAFVCYKIWTRKYKYWEDNGVPQVNPSFPLGTLGFKLFKAEEHYCEATRRIYNQFKGEKYVGIYSLREPQLLLRDPELIKQIMTKDFKHFVNRGMFPILKHDYLTHHLFNMEGDSWKKMRTKLSPTFTSGKMKLMFNLIEVVAQQLSDYLKPLAEKNSEIEIKDLAARFNTDIIATCAFGLEVDSLKNPKSEFREMGRLIFDFTFLQHIVVKIMLFIPSLTKVLPLVLFNTKVAKFIINVLENTIEYRKKNNVVRNDFIDLLTKVKDKTLTIDKDEEAYDEAVFKNVQSHDFDDELTLTEMAAQMFIFFAAGFETASSTTAFLLYEMSKNKEIQEKARAEIDSVIKNNEGKVTYKAIHEMHYLDKCIDETLRRHASLSFLRRQCVKTYKVPDTDLVIEKDIKVVIPTHAIHHDPEYYPDPFKFDPERFSEEAIKTRHRYTHLPFGEGPRLCIGKRLGLIQVKMAIITILKDYEVTPSPGLPDPLPINPRVTITTTAVPIYLVVSKRKF